MLSGGDGLRDGILGRGLILGGAGVRRALEAGGLDRLMAGDTPIAVRTLQAGPSWPSDGPWPPRVRSGFVNCQMSDRT